MPTRYQYILMTNNPNITVMRINVSLYLCTILCVSCILTNERMKCTANSVNADDSSSGDGPNINKRLVAILSSDRFYFLVNFLHCYLIFKLFRLIAMIRTLNVQGEKETESQVLYLNFFITPPAMCVYTSQKGTDLGFWVLSGFICLFSYQCNHVNYK